MDRGGRVKTENVSRHKYVKTKEVESHPKTKLYIMQGGLQSLQEAVHYQVPVIAIPFFGDQNFNAKKIVDLKIGLTINIDNINESILISSINEIIYNKIYKSNIKKLSAMVKDEQIKPMQRAVWNVEHLMKFPNALHYTYYGREMSYLQYYGTVIIVYTLIGIVILCTLYLPILFCYYIITNSKQIKIK